MERFELPTICLEGKRSIQMSYIAKKCRPKEKQKQTNLVRFCWNRRFFLFLQNPRFFYGLRENWTLNFFLSTIGFKKKFSIGNPKKLWVDFAIQDLVLMNHSPKWFKPTSSLSLKSLGGGTTSSSLILKSVRLELTPLSHCNTETSAALSADLNGRSVRANLIKLRFQISEHEPFGFYFFRLLRKGKKILNFPRFSNLLFADMGVEPNISTLWG